MSAKAIESGEGGALDTLLPELLSEEEEEPSQSSNQASDGSSPGKTPQGPHQGPHQGPDGSASDPRDPPKSKGSNFYDYAGKTATAVIGGALAMAALPAVLGAIGLTGAGSLVATLQSVGAAGLSTSSNILLGSAGSVFGMWMWGSKKKAPPPPGSSTE